MLHHISVMRMIIPGIGDMIGGGNLKYREEDMPRCESGCHKFHVDRLRNEPRPTR
jgi:hypothetical protein